MTAIRRRREKRRRVCVAESVECPTRRRIRGRQDRSRPEDLAHGDDRVGLVGVDDREREDAAELSHSRSHCLFERGVVFEIFLDQVGHDLGVSFSDEAVIGFAQPLF